MIKKFIVILYSLVFFLPITFLFNQPAYAASLFRDSCTISYEPNPVNKDTQDVTVTIDTHGQAGGSNYNLALWHGGAFGVPGQWGLNVGAENLTADKDGKITTKINNIQSWVDESRKQVQVNLLRADERGLLNENVKCRGTLAIPINISSSGTALCKIQFQDQTYDVDPKSENFDPAKFMRPGNSIKASATCPDTNKNSFMCQEENQSWLAQVFIKNGNGTIVNAKDTTVGGLKTGVVLDPLEQGNYLLDIQVPIQRNIIDTFLTRATYYECSKGFVVDSSGGGVGCSSDNDCAGNQNGRYCLPDKTGALSCQNTENGLAINPCITKNGSYICQTAIGAIGTSAGAFAKGVLQLFLGLAGIILLFMIILNGYKFMTSQGDPEKVKEARESITSAVAGLLVIIFSVVVLQLITVDILHLPGFSK